MSLCQTDGSTYRDGWTAGRVHSQLGCVLQSARHCSISEWRKEIQELVGSMVAPAAVKTTKMTSNQSAMDAIPDAMV